MAVQVTGDSVKKLFLYRCMIANFSSPFSVTAFSGVQPSAANIVSSWSTYNTQYLVHWRPATWFSFDWQATQPVASLTTPIANTSFGTGTATWGILWTTNHTEATIQASTLPGTSFMVVPVTDTTGNGVIRVSNTSIVSSTSVTLQDLNLSVTFTF